MTLKRIGKILIYCCLAAIMTVCAAACGNPSGDNSGTGGTGETGGTKVDKNTLFDIYDPDRPDYGFDYESDYVRPDPPVAETRLDPDPDPAYAKGTATTVTKMEAENAVVELKGTSAETWKNEYSDVNNMAFDFRLSNKLATRNLNTPGTRIIFNFKSNQSYTVKMLLNMSAYNQATAPYLLKGNLGIRSEGKVDGDIVYSYADTTGKQIEWDSTVEKVSGGMAASEYFHFASVELNVAIYKGDTKIIIEYEGKGGGNVDFIELNTSASITGFDATHYMDGKTAAPGGDASHWYVSQFPTDDEDGTFSVKRYMNGSYRSYTYGLPKYKTDGQLTAGYTAAVLPSGKTQYSFAFKTGTFSFVDDPDMTTTVTLKNYPDVKFADGTAMLSKKPGEILEAADFAPITGGRTIETMNVIDSQERLLGQASVGQWAFLMENVAIEVTSFSPESGYTALTLGSGSNNGYNFDGISESAFNGKINISNKNAIVKGTAFAERGVVIKAAGTIPADSPVRFDTKFAVTAGIFEYKYNFENRGTSKVALSLKQILASSEYKNNTAVFLQRYPLAIQLEAGQSVTLTAQYQSTGTNSNALMYFVSTEEMNGLDLGVAVSVKKLSITTLEHPYSPACVLGTCDHLVTKHTLTLDPSVSVTFAGGGKTAQVAEGAALPTITNGTGETIVGWKNVNNESQTWTAAGFTMPAGDITITPVFATKYTLTLADGVDVTFAGGVKTAQLAEGASLPAVTNNTGETIVGWKNADNASETWTTSNFTMPAGNITITPVFAAKYTLTLDPSANVTFDSGVKTAQLIEGAPLPAVTNSTGRTIIGWYNIDNENQTWTYSGFTMPAGDITIAPQFATNYTLTLTGDAAVTFEGGSKTASVAESSALPVIVNNTGRGITGWYNVADENETWTADDFRMPTRDITIAPIYLVTYSLILSDDVAITFGDGTKTCELAVGEELPAIINNTGRTIIGWYNADIITESWVDFTMPGYEIEIKPYFSPLNGGQALIAASGKTDNLPDYFQNTEIPDSGTTYVKTNFSNEPHYVADERGILLSYNGNLIANDFFRLLTACGTSGTSNGVLAGLIYKFQYNFTNFGTESITFELFQTQSGILMTSESGAVSSGNVTIAAGATVSVSVNIKFAANNGNAITIFLMKAPVTDMKLGISMSKVNDIIVNPETKFALTLSSANGLTFEGGATTVQLAEGAPLPEVVNATGRVVGGWYDGTATWTSAGFRMPASAVTILPYFAKVAGYLDLVPMSEQGTGKPANLSANLDIANFTADLTKRSVNDTIVNGGAGGFAEAGKTIQYTGAMPKDAQFRLNTIAGTTAVITTNIVHTFRYNLENKGTNTIDIMLFQINSSTTVETGDTGHRILLAPGESMMIEFSMMLKLGSANKNALTLIRVNAAEGMADMKLGISMSIKLGA